MDSLPSEAPLCPQLPPHLCSLKRFFRQIHTNQTWRLALATAVAQPVYYSQIVFMSGGAELTAIMLISSGPAPSVLCAHCVRDELQPATRGRPAVLCFTELER